jgi:hypothetical protein
LTLPSYFRNISPAPTAEQTLKGENTMLKQLDFATNQRMRTESIAVYRACDLLAPIALPVAQAGINFV